MRTTRFSRLVTLLFALTLVLSSCYRAPGLVSLWGYTCASDGYRRLIMPHFSLTYPLEHYSVRTESATALTADKALVQPGIVEVVPNDSLLYGVYRVDTAYKLSIAAAPTEASLGSELLEQGLMIEYAADLLEQIPVQETELGGVAALRVDNLPVGQSGIAAQIVAVYNDLRYEVLIEPVGAGMTAPNSGAALYEEILATFTFDPAPTPEPVYDEPVDQPRSPLD